MRIRIILPLPSLVPAEAEEEATSVKKLAADYGIDLYDRKLLRLASEDSGINEAIFANADENTKKTFFIPCLKKSLQRRSHS